MGELREFVVTTDEDDVTVALLKSAKPLLELTKELVDRLRAATYTEGPTFRAEVATLINRAEGEILKAEGRV